MAIKQASVSQIRAGLLHLRATPSARNFGICNSLEYYMDHQAGGVWAGQWLCDNVPKWPKYSGDEAYPVRDPNNPLSASRQFWEHEHDGVDRMTQLMWSLDNAYGRLRLELLDFLIERAEAELKAGGDAALAT